MFLLYVITGNKRECKYSLISELGKVKVKRKNVKQETNFCDCNIWA